MNAGRPDEYVDADALQGAPLSGQVQIMEDIRGEVQTRCVRPNDSLITGVASFWPPVQPSITSLRTFLEEVNVRRPDELAKSCADDKARVADNDRVEFGRCERGRSLNLGHQPLELTSLPRSSATCRLYR